MPLMSWYPTMKPSLKLLWGTASLFIVPSMNCRPNRQLPPKAPPSPEAN